MRDYGIVKVRFWEWAKAKSLSPPARELALYTLTSPHSNSIGFYRLPVAYIADDLGTVPDTVRHTVSELVKTGFLRHDEKSGWSWIVGYLDHNPIANGNVGKSLVPFIEGIPRNLPFFGDFVASLACQGNRFPEGFIDRLANGIGNGFGNGMPNHDQIQEQEHDQTQEQEHDQTQEHEHDICTAAPLLSTLPEKVRDEDLAIQIWNDAAERNGWPSKRSPLTKPQRRQLRARIGDDIGRWREAIEKCEASDFLSGRQEPDEKHKNWRLKLAFLLREDKFNAVLDDEYCNSGRTVRPPAAVGKVAAMQAAKEQFRKREGGLS